MSTAAPEPNRAFAVWITGLPASGKSTLAAALKDELARRGVRVAVLESDLMRQVLTPEPRYDEAERALFYRQLAWIGGLLYEHGVPVIFDATANRRSYREQGRNRMARFFEVYVATPLDVCRSRDPKGIYRRVGADPVAKVPGVGDAYEPPAAPDAVVRGDQEDAAQAARRIAILLAERGFLVPIL